MKKFLLALMISVLPISASFAAECELSRTMAIDEVKANVPKVQDIHLTGDRLEKFLKVVAQEAGTPYSKPAFDSLDIFTSKGAENDLVVISNKGCVLKVLNVSHEGTQVLMKKAFGVQV